VLLKKERQIHFPVYLHFRLRMMKRRRAKKKTRMMKTLT
jgi:hypothetical protein